MCDAESQQTHRPTVAAKKTAGLLLYSFPGVIFQYEWGLQMANDVTMPTNVPILNTEYIDGLLSSSWLHVVIMLFSLAWKVQQLHVQEDRYANITAPLWSCTWHKLQNPSITRESCKREIKNLTDKCWMDNVHILLFLFGTPDLMLTLLYLVQYMSPCPSLMSSSSSQSGSHQTRMNLEVTVIKSSICIWHWSKWSN